MVAVLGTAVSDAAGRTCPKLTDVTGYAKPDRARAWIEETAYDDEPGTFGWWARLIGADVEALLIGISYHVEDLKIEEAA